MNCTFVPTDRLDLKGNLLFRCPRCRKLWPSNRLHVNCIRPGDTVIEYALSAGPGTELRLLFGQLNLHGKDDCGCAGMAAEMDMLGAEGCRAKAAELADRLRQKAAEVGWKEKLSAGILAAWNGLPLTIEGLLEEAIRRAEVKQQAEARSVIPRQATPPPAA